MGPQKIFLLILFINREWCAEEKDEGDRVIGGCTKLVFEQMFTQHFLKGEEG